MEDTTNKKEMLKVPNNKPGAPTPNQKSAEATKMPPPLSPRGTPGKCIVGPKSAKERISNIQRSRSEEKGKTGSQEEIKNRSRSPMLTKGTTSIPTKGMQKEACKQKSSEMLGPEQSEDTEDDGSELETQALGIGSKASRILKKEHQKRGIAFTTGDANEENAESEARQKLRQLQEEMEYTLENEVTGKLQKACVIYDRQDGSLSNTPVEDLVSSIMESMEAVEAVSTVSKGLKGTLSKRLKVASTNVRVITDELNLRLAGNTNNPAQGGDARLKRKLRQAEADNTRIRQERDELRKDVQKLRLEMKELREEMEKLRRAIPTAPETSTPSQRPEASSSSTRNEIIAEAQRSREDAGGGTETTVMEVEIDGPTRFLTQANKTPTYPTVGDEGTTGKVSEESSTLKELLSYIKVLVENRYEERQSRQSQRGVEEQEKNMGAPRPGKAPRAKRTRLVSAKSKETGQNRNAVNNQGEAAENPTSNSGTEMGNNAPAVVHSASKEGEWATVVKRGKKGGTAKTAGSQNRTHLPDGKTGNSGQGNKKGSGRREPTERPPPTSASANLKRRRVPKTAAITISCPTGEYEKIIKEAKGKIVLSSFNIDGLRVRRTMTGALSYEVTGPEGKGKADLLATKLREVFQDRPEVRIARPTKTAEMRISGLDDTTTPTEVAKALVSTGGCDPTSVKVGNIRRAPNGLGTVWVTCPLAAAKTVASAGRLQVGWLWTKATLLDERPLQCFKCLEVGHVRTQCPNSVDRSNRCYRCGTDGHKARECTAAPKCPVCTDLGKPAAHRLGSKTCSANHPEKRMRKPGAPRPQSNPRSWEERERVRGTEETAATTTTTTPSTPSVEEDPAPENMEVELQRTKRKGEPSSPEIGGARKKRTSGEREECAPPPPTPPRADCAEDANSGKQQ